VCSEDRQDKTAERRRRKMAETHGGQGIRRRIRKSPVDGTYAEYRRGDVLVRHRISARRPPARRVGTILFLIRFDRKIVPLAIRKPWIVKTRILPAKSVARPLAKKAGGANQSHSAN